MLATLHCSQQQKRYYIIDCENEVIRLHKYGQNLA